MWIAAHEQNIVLMVMNHRGSTHYLNGEFSYPGGRLNKKDGLTRYGDSHVKDKTS